MYEFHRDMYASVDNNVATLCHRVMSKTHSIELQTAEARIKHRALLTWQDIRKY